MSTSIVSIPDYFGPWADHKDVTMQVMSDAMDFLPKVNALLQEAIDGGVDLVINPKTKTYISGETYGGFRPQSCPQGAPNSSHKVGRGVDIFDPFNDLDGWLSVYEGPNGSNSKLKAYGLFREAPEDTIHWCHLTDRSPKSGRETFKP